MLDFKKLSDPVFKGEFQARQEARQALQDVKDKALMSALNVCDEHVDDLNASERSFVRSCRQRMGMAPILSPKQETWLLDIAKKFKPQSMALTLAEPESTQSQPECVYTFFFGADSPFSNWYMSDFTLEDQTFNCNEQYMMWRKANLFNDTSTANKVMTLYHPKDHKAEGRKVVNFDLSTWQTHRDAIMMDGLRAKFEQNPKLQAVLMKNESTIFVEASPYDKIWGIGLAESDPRAKDPQQWKGLNLLGNALTALRNELLATNTEEITKPAARVFKF